MPPTSQEPPRAGADEFAAPSVVPGDAPSAQAAAEPMRTDPITPAQRMQNRRLAGLVVMIVFVVLFSTFAITIFIHYAGLHHSVLAPQ